MPERPHRRPLGESAAFLLRHIALAGRAVGLLAMLAVLLASAAVTLLIRVVVRLWVVVWTKAWAVATVQAHRQGTPGARADGRRAQERVDRCAPVVTGGAVEKHISNVFAKLGLAEGDSHNRRVLAVLTYLRSGT
jgi:hypothetical protein